METHKIAIIGAGNMGGAMAKAFSQAADFSLEIRVSNPSKEKLDALQSFNPAIITTTSNNEAAENADMIILAVKPWFIQSVLAGLHLEHTEQIIVSVAAGVSFNDIRGFIPRPQGPIFRVIPNSAISELESTNIIAADQATAEQKAFVKKLFDTTGYSTFVDEPHFDAAMSLSSCGIAYVFKYVQAATQAGVELGLKPSEARKMVAQSLKGAAAILLNNDAHPSVEIDKVTTPGGRTIKGINALEEHGFTAAVIAAVKAAV